MKTHLLVAITFLLLFACKKDKKTEEETINHSERIKTIRISYFNNGIVYTKSVFSYHYDGLNRLNHVSLSDSNLVGGKWQTRRDDSLATYKYNTSNKVIKIVQSSMNFEVDYFYDTNQFLAMSCEKFENGHVDTSFYSKNGNMIITNAYKYNGLEKSFYETNIDSIISFDSSNVILQRTINYFGTKADLSSAYLNTFFSYRNQNEIISSIKKLYTGGTSITETTNYTYIYDNQNYPIKFTSKTASVLNFIYDYTYY